MVLVVFCRGCPHHCYCGGGEVAIVFLVVDVGTFEIVMLLLVRRRQ